LRVQGIAFVFVIQLMISCTFLVFLPFVVWAGGGGGRRRRHNQQQREEQLHSESEEKEVNVKTVIVSEIIVPLLCYGYQLTTFTLLKCLSVMSR